MLKILPSTRRDRFIWRMGPTTLNLLVSVTTGVVINIVTSHISSAWDIAALFSGLIACVCFGVLCVIRQKLADNYQYNKGVNDRAEDAKKRVMEDEIWPETILQSGQLTKGFITLFGAGVALVSVCLTIIITKDVLGTDKEANTKESFTQIKEKLDSIMQKQTMAIFANHKFSDSCCKKELKVSEKGQQKRPQF